jgi:hypothetical protein
MTAAARRTDRSSQPGQLVAQYAGGGVRHERGRVVIPDDRGERAAVALARAGQEVAEILGRVSQAVARRPLITYGVASGWR